MQCNAVLLIAAAFISFNCCAANSLYNIQERIPKTGKSVLITKQLQAVIDQCSDEGGGTIYFPAGEYLTGSIILKSNTYLELSPGAILYGSTDVKDYTEKACKSLIYAKEASNVGIVGQGIINGNGDSFWRGKEDIVRPDRFLLFEDCQRIRINGITLLNSPNWNLELLNCDYAWIDGVSMISDIDSPNTDGIDPTSSSHIFISNCYFELGDDAICPKSRGTKPTEYIVVENCVIKSDDSAIKLGTRSEAPIRHMTFNNIVIKDTQYGIAFFAKDGGVFEDVRFSNIIIESVRSEDSKSDRPSGSYPIFLDIERRSPDGLLTAIKDIHFSDITINSYDGHCMCLGQPDLNIENLYFNNITYNLQKHRTFEGANKPRGVKSLRNKANNDYAHIPANFTFAHVKNLHIAGLDITDYDKSGEYERHMIWGYDIHNVQIAGFANHLASPNGSLAQLKFKDATGIEITASHPESSKTPFVFLEGTKTRDVKLLNNNFCNVDTVIQTDQTVDKTQIREFNNLNK